MPEYDPVNYPKTMLPDLRPDTPLGEPEFTSWPDNKTLPDQYAGPTPDREFETAPLGRNLTGKPVPPVPAPADAPAPEPSIAPPPSSKDPAQRTAGLGEG